MSAEIELYIHIPFCIRKCNYCDFLSFPAGEETRKRYMKALFTELEGRSGECGGYEVSSVFIGGGTPSVLEPDMVEELFGTIRESYRLHPEAEITLECNPATADREKLKRYRRAGINRLSVGLQSASGEELKTLGRIHTFEQFLETYSLAREAGFTNVNVDIMSALPGQSISSYEKTLRAVLNLKPMPEHISAYSLIVEEGTPFYRMKEQGTLFLPDEEEERLMYYRTKELLAQAGYRRYEISNYALPGYECRHNKGYWTRKEYLGFGIGAASLYREARFVNSSDMDAYIEAPMAARSAPEPLSAREQMEETMFLGLRLMDGVTEEAFKAGFGCGLMDVYAPVIARNQADGLLLYRDGRLWLTEKGIDLSNYVLAQFLL